MVNLGVAFASQRFDERALAQSLNAIEHLGFTVERGRGSGAFLAWIDDEFGGTWSSEAFAGESIIAKKGDAFAGFATYDPRGLRFSWLRGAGAQAGTGIFGPFGVARAFRGSGIGPHLLVAALASLDERGYERALIPAVGDEKLIAYYQQHCGAEIVERFDRARWFEKKIRTVVLASGNGSNFQSVLDRSRDGRLPLEITALVSNRSGAYALERARSAGIAARTVRWDRAAQTRAAYDALLLETVRAEEPQLVLLLGWMHLLPREFVDAFPAINIHPAFLPLDQSANEVTFPDGAISAAFRGANAVADAVAAGCSWTGASAHLVSHDFDRGPILTRKPLPIMPDEPIESIMERLHPLEHVTLAGGIMRWIFEQ